MKYPGRRKPNGRGFTLIELMITMLILAILVLIVVMTLAVSRKKAEEATCKANLRTIFSAIAEYQTVHMGYYPPNLDVLITPTDPGEDPYLKSNFKWTCPSGSLDGVSIDYRDYYSSVTGHTSCPRASHNP